MAWIQIRLNSTNEKAEKISDFLEEIGSVSVTFMDSQDTPIFEPLPGETRLWGNTDVIALFDAETDMNEIVSLLKQAHHLDENKMISLNIDEGIIFNKVVEDFDFRAVVSSLSVVSSVAVSVSVFAATGLVPIRVAEIVSADINNVNERFFMIISSPLSSYFL
mgnify:CR=1 FL=1